MADAIGLCLGVVLFLEEEEGLCAAQGGSRYGPGFTLPFIVGFFSNFFKKRKNISF